LAKYLRYFAHDFEAGLLVNGLPFSTNFIFDLFELEFGKCPSKGITKLLVHFVEDRSRHLRAEEFLNVLCVDMFLEVARLQEKSDLEQRQVFLECILVAIKSAGPTYGWDLEHAEEVYQRILADGILFDRAWGKRVKLAGSKQSVQAHVRYSHAIELTLNILNAQQEVVQSALVATLPGTIGALLDAYGTLSWTSDKVVRLQRTNQRDYWEYDLAANAVRFHFARAEAGDPHGQYDLGRMYLDGYLVPQDEALARHWFEQAAAQGFGRAQTALARLSSESS
jgi:hypothetical protein